MKLKLLSPCKLQIGIFICEVNFSITLFQFQKLWLIYTFWLFKLKKWNFIIFRIYFDFFQTSTDLKMIQNT